MAMRNRGASPRRSRRIPSGKNRMGWGIRTAQPNAAVAPVRQGVGVIRDPYTNRAAGQIALTVHMLFPFVLKRKGGWAQIAFKHTA